MMTFDIECLDSAKDLYYVIDDKGRIFGPCSSAGAIKLVAFLKTLKAKYILEAALKKLNEIYLVNQKQQQQISALKAIEAMQDAVEAAEKKMNQTTEKDEDTFSSPKH